ncbi:MAG: endosialidase [Clostridium sp.]|nr:endosialidase [Clostridium sp.]
MPVIEELICIEQDGTISFGNYKLGQKAKKSDFEYQGDMYKVKTYNEITKLERNDMFVYESVPGTAAEHFKVTDEGVEFAVEGSQDAQITVQLENDTDYEVYVNDMAVGSMMTNMSGKLSVSVELEEGIAVQVKAVKRI